jgi:nicotinate-nucleotide adenylyltransferase
VHLAHLRLAQTAMAQLDLDELRWLPAGQPWQKADQTLAPAEHRAAMVSLMIAGQPGMSLDRSELDRTGPSYTIDTVEALSQSLPGVELFLLIGQDQYARLPTWHRWEALLGRVQLAVAGRAANKPQAPPELADKSHQVRLLDMPAMEISSSEVRQRVAGGDNIAPLVGETVAGYIASHRLYQASPHVPQALAP